MMLPRTILVPIDLDDLAGVVLDYAVTLAERIDAQLHVIHAVPPPLLGAEIPSALAQATVDELAANARKRLEPVIAPYREAGDIVSVSVEIGDVIGVVLATADKVHADLIVTGTHGRRGVSRLVLGSVAEQIARRAPCPVALVRDLPPRRSAA